MLKSMLELQMLAHMLLGTLLELQAAPLAQIPEAPLPVMQVLITQNTTSMTPCSSFSMLSSSEW
jgi:hypothetical protein